MVDVVVGIDVVVGLGVVLRRGVVVGLTVVVLVVVGDDGGSTSFVSRYDVELSSLKLT